MASTAATATSFATPNDTSTADRPTVPTAVPPPGTGTIDAMVTTPMLAASSAQNDTCPPKATRQTCRHQVDSTSATTFPTISSATCRGDRNASTMVAVARESGGSTFARTSGSSATTALTTTKSPAAITSVRSSPLVGIRERSMRAGSTRSATPKHPNAATSAPKPLSTPPAATADERSTPSFCRNRICMP